MLMSDRSLMYQNDWVYKRWRVDEGGMKRRYRRVKIEMTEDRV